MKLDKKKRLAEKGWRVGSVQELLGLSPEEATIVDLRLKLADALGGSERPVKK